MRLSSFLLRASIMIIVAGCSDEEEEPVTKPIVNTTPISNVAQVTAQGGGNVTDDGNGDIMARGVVWASSPNPTASLTTKTSDGPGLGSFLSNITGLTANTKYFVRAYATNSAGTSYGSELTFTTLADAPPTVSTALASAITESTATVAGNVLTAGSTTVSARGVVWSTASNPETNLSTKTFNGSGTGEFSASLTGLVPNTVYFARAYAVNLAGTAYGNQVTFTTLNNMATVVTSSATGVTSTTASVEGNVTESGTTTVTARGIVWNISPAPTTSNFKSTNGTGLGVFTASLTSLLSSTKYYARAYATNSAGTVYGSEITFTTSALQNLSLSLDGNDDYVSVPDDDALDVSTTYTLEAWVNMYSYHQFSGIISKYNNPGGLGYMLRMSSSDPYDEISFDGMETQNFNMVLGIWYHIAAVNNNGVRTLYVNGSKVPLTGSADFVNPNINDNPLRIGSDYSSRLFHGVIDEVRIWKVARTAEEIDASWDAQLTGAEANLVAYYPMKTEATANGANTGRTTLLDMTANANHGTLSNFGFGGNTSNWTVNYTKPTLTVGQNYLGGKIAYINSSGHHGFVVNPSNDYANMWWTGTNVNITTSNAIGTGQANSSSILAADTGPLCGSFCTNTAAGVCDKMEFDAYTDWYLPSIDELNQIYLNRAVLGSFADGLYWSSTQYTVDNALMLQFGMDSNTGTVYQDSKSNVWKIRAIRSF